MKTLNLKMPVSIPVKNMKYYFQAIILVLLWYSAPYLFPLPDGNSFEMMNSIGLMVLLALVIFLFMVGLCWWLLQRFWVSVGLPGSGSMVLQFKELPSWEQLKFWLASFALLLLALAMCFMAVL